MPEIRSSGSMPVVITTKPNGILLERELNAIQTEHLAEFSWSDLERVGLRKIESPQT